MNCPKRRFAAGVALIYLSQVSALSAQSPKSDAKPSRQQVVLVELFTSEGCSDCPPADELLSKIDRKQTNSGQLVVGISEHVTYWNRLGWADPFSLGIYDQRQDSYGSKFGLDSVYTPQMVVNGSEQFVGSSSAKLAQALAKEAERASPVALQILSARVTQGVLNFSYSASGEFPSQGLDLLAVLADDIDRSSVSRGENSGRSLTHVSVARSLTHIAKLKTGVESTGEIALPASYQSTQTHHLILFAQALGTGRVLDAAVKPF